jgi:hypothetical protein
MPRLMQRLRSLFLATLYVLGNFASPATDVLLNHGVGAPDQTPRVHFEGRGGCLDHSGHCALDRLLGELRVQASGSPPATLKGRVGVTSPPLSTPRVALAARPYTHRSRAPPVSV